MENVLYAELVSRGYNVDVGVINTSETNAEGRSSRKQLEIDFVCNKGSWRYYVQSAYSLPTHKRLCRSKGRFSRLMTRTRRLSLPRTWLPLDTPRRASW